MSQEATAHGLIRGITSYGDEDAVRAATGRPAEERLSMSSGFDTGEADAPTRLAS